MFAFNKIHALLLGSCSLILFSPLSDIALAQTADAPLPSAATTAPAASAPAATDVPADQALPEINVTAPRRDPDAERRRARVVIHTEPSPSSEQVTANVNANLDAARNNIVAPTGASSTTLSRESIRAMPQGTEAPLDKVLLQFP
ncbi:MAG: hypothetical protein NTZ72_04985, partial [Afipia sp.]|nr:hypothetical protein [Afipia sp.]